MKLVKYLSYLLLAVSAVLIVLFYAQGTPETMVSTILGWAYILLALALVCMVVLPLFFRDGKKMNKSTLLAYGIFAVVVVVAVLFFIVPDIKLRFTFTFELSYVNIIPPPLSAAVLS